MKKCIALVIGINNYESYPKLSAAINDANAIGEKLEKLKYNVTYCLDEECYVVKRNIETFEEEISSNQYDVALFYFAGHGCIANKSDCLLLKEAPLLQISPNNEVKIRNKSITLDDISNRMRGAGNQINILIVDACRSEITRSSDMGFEFGKCSKLPYQTYIAYSTSPGTTAKDGIKHSPYTQSLLSHIEEENLPIEHLFKKIRTEIYPSIGQLSWEHSCLVDDFCFNYGQTKPYYEFPYSLNALEDQNYIGSPDTEAQGIIDLFKSYNVYKQEAALQKFHKYHKSLTNNDKFVIGRNILQAAAGNCFKCIDEISYAQLSLYQTNEGNPVLDGILYEMYFNSQNTFRSKQKGIEMINTIARLMPYREFDKSKSFIRKVLSPYTKSLNYIPGDTQQHNVIIEIEFYDFGEGDDDTIWSIQSIQYKQKTITKDLSKKYGTHTINYTKAGIINQLSDHLGIPHAYLKIKFSNETTSQDKFIYPIDYSDLL